ncbi:MAG: hypothetical protein AVDCRST_MAG08-311, partial [uncultured Acetobacteraceae bacterium]
ERRHRRGRARAPRRGRAGRPARRQPAAGARHRLPVDGDGRRAGGAGQLADLLALHRRHPRLHLDGGAGALLPGLCRDARRDAGGAGRHAFHRRCLPPPVPARRGEGGAAVRLLRRALRPGLPVVGLGIHGVRHLPHQRVGRAPALAHPHGLAHRRPRLAALPNRAHGGRDPGAARARRL